ncbi:carboxymuconolactone decarboxylase family protein [Variovorax paradoxus B4]|uniref:Carboxymuconolactone decarboxylase family protein n=1 Tax=Variovorax paradoxus B4 TaxID=1246301 RepID=T1XE36_VARPD|nr:carboxymuconolactone decarboxylase family protein [Variovorax paradoxus]AGU50761.1 carboxymuconolactone decarboxylase family protein [Variovorax paradoxus B4]
MPTLAAPRASAPRIPPLEAPFPELIADLLNRMNPPGRTDILALFRVLAINPELAERTLGLGRYLLGRKAAIGLRDREVVITRACARCGAEYEWGVHVAAFGDAAGFSATDRRVMASAAEDVELLAPRDRLLVSMVDQLHDTCHVDDMLWEALSAHWSPPQLIELMMLAGWYHAVSYVCNAARVPLEKWAARW